MSSRTSRAVSSALSIAALLSPSVAHATQPKCDLPTKKTSPEDVETSRVALEQATRKLADTTAELQSARTRRDAAVDRLGDTNAHAQGEAEAASKNLKVAEEARRDARETALCSQGAFDAVEYGASYTRAVFVSFAAAQSVGRPNRTGGGLHFAFRTSVALEWEISLTASRFVESVLAPPATNRENSLMLGFFPFKAYFGRARLRTINTAFFLGAGAELIERGPDRTFTLVGQLGLRFRPSAIDDLWLTDMKLFAEPRAIGSSGKGGFTNDRREPVTVLFGVELAFGAGWSHLK